MDDQSQVGQKRRRRSRAEADQLVAEYEASGLCQQEFCQSRGMSPATLARYRKRVREAGGESAVAARWVSVEVSGASDGNGSGLAIALGGGRRIEVGRGFHAGTLIQLLSVLERG